MMTSGYTANEGLISTIMEPGDWVATDELNHACIVDGLRLAKCRRYSYRHNDLNHLEDGLKAEAGRSDPDRARFIITESLFSMDGDRAPLPEIAALANLAEPDGTVGTVCVYQASSPEASCTVLSSTFATSIAICP